MPENKKAFDLNNPIHFGIGVIIIIIAIMFLVNTFAFKPTPQELDAIAQCITAKGGVMYGTDWCPHCQEQKAAFENSFQYINFVDCDANRQACSLQGITGYPTWKINGQTLSGTQPIKTLAKTADCL